MDMVGCGERRVLEGLREGPCARDLEVCFGVRTTMAEGEAGAKIRVVRCPKCEKLLPELGNFSVYSCGGCGATLQGEFFRPRRFYFLSINPLILRFRSCCNL